MIEIASAPFQQIRWEESLSLSLCSDLVLFFFCPVQHKHFLLEPFLLDHITMEYIHMELFLMEHIPMELFPMYIHSENFLLAT